MSAHFLVPSLQHPRQFDPSGQLCVAASAAALSAGENAASPLLNPPMMARTIALQQKEEAQSMTCRDAGVRA